MFFVLFFAYLSIHSKFPSSSQRRQNWPNLPSSHFPDNSLFVKNTHLPPSPWLSISKPPALITTSNQKNLLSADCAFVSTKGSQGAQFSLFNDHLQYFPHSLPSWSWSSDLYDFRKSHVLNPHHGDGDGVTHPLGELSEGSQKAAPVLACVLQPAPGCNHHHVIMGMVMFTMFMMGCAPFTTDPFTTLSLSSWPWPCWL